MNNTEETLKPLNHGHEFFYSVLNLNSAASQAEVNERYRTLSLVFHPDKQQDEELKTIATQNFLQIQKAHEVLSDPFLRTVYDTLGEEGLALKWAPQFRSKSIEEVRDVLGQIKKDIRYEKSNRQILPKGLLTCAINASSLFAPYLGSSDDSWTQQLFHRFEDVRIVDPGLRHSVEKTLDAKTTVSLESSIRRHSKGTSFVCLGTIRHQFSPRLSSETTFTILNPHTVNLSLSYRGDEGRATVRTRFAPILSDRIPPSLTISVSRKLFRWRPEVASVELLVDRDPYLKFDITTPSIFGNLVGLELPSGALSPPPSISGLKFGTTQKVFGVIFQGLLPAVFGNFEVAFVELALRLKLGFEFGLRGFSYVVTGIWSNQTSEVTAATVFHAGGVVLELGVAYREQRLSLPIILALEPDPPLAFWVLFVPSSVLALGYHLVIRPRRRMQRLAHIRAARQALEEGSGMRREREAVINLLKDTARRSKKAESNKGGLVIIEATYDSADKDDGAMDLAIDVTIPMQALVRNSQLYIAASQTRSDIQGFSDPAPSTEKELKIRYVFGGLTHYAEIPDHSPVVLPLAEHFIN